MAFQGFAMKMKRNSSYLRTLTALLAGFVCCCALAASVAPVAAEHGMVVTAQHLASRVGVDVLKKGGNAQQQTKPASNAVSVRR